MRTSATETPAIEPTRRLLVKERAVFDRILSQFVHLVPSDSEQLTQYSEAVVRYEAAKRETRKHPSVAVPVVNRSTGNVVGEKIVRNPMFTTLREAQQQMTSLARRLLIDAHSEEKRQRMLTKKARALRAAEHAQAEDAGETFTEEQIAAEMDRLVRQGYTPRGEALRNLALSELRISRDLEGIADDPDCAYLFADPPA